MEKILRFHFKAKFTEIKHRELHKGIKKIKLILKVFTMDMIKNQTK